MRLSTWLQVLLILTSVAQQAIAKQVEIFYRSNTTRVPDNADLTFSNPWNASLQDTGRAMLFAAAARPTGSIQSLMSLDLDGSINKIIQTGDPIVLGTGYQGDATYCNSTTLFEIPYEGTTHGGPQLAPIDRGLPIPEFQLSVTLGTPPAIPGRIHGEGLIANLTHRFVPGQTPQTILRSRVIGNLNGYADFERFRFAPCMSPVPAVFTPVQYEGEYFLLGQAGNLGLYRSLTTALGGAANGPQDSLVSSREDNVRQTGQLTTLLVLPIANRRGSNLAANGDFVSVVNAFNQTTLETRWFLTYARASSGGPSFAIVGEGEAAPDFEQGWKFLDVNGVSTAWIPNRNPNQVTFFATLTRPVLGQLAAQNHAIFYYSPQDTGISSVRKIVEDGSIFEDLLSSDQSRYRIVALDFPGGGNTASHYAIQQDVPGDGNQCSCSGDGPQAVQQSGWLRGADRVCGDAVPPSP